MMQNHARLLSLLLVVVPVALPRAQQQQQQQETPPQPQQLTIADLARDIAWVGELPTARWAADGQHVELRQAGRVQWLEPGSGKIVEPTPRPTPTPDGGASRRVLLFEGDLYLDDAVPEVSDAPPSGRAGRPGGGAGARRADRPSERAVRLTSDGDKGGKKELPFLAPDHRHVAFVRGNNLVLVGVADQQQWPVTMDGGPKLFHGALDWVYQEEIYGRGNFRGHWWSPNSAAVAFLSLDEAAVLDFTVVNHVPEGFLDRTRGVDTEVTSYPKPGDPNPTARLSIADVAARKVVAVDLSGFPADLLVVRVGWTPDAARLLVTVQDRIQTEASLVAIDPATGAGTRWIHERSTSWVPRPDEPRWLRDGSFLWLSARTGYQHVYHYRPGGELVRPVTSGDWQVRSIVRVDEANGVLFFDGTRDGATGRHLYRVNLDGTGLVHLTPGIGTHQASLDASGRHVLDQWSALDQPPVLRVLDARDGSLVREIARADRGKAASQYAFSDKQRIAIPARDGYELDASIQWPPGRDPAQRHPVYLATYSGPNSQSVRDQWSPSTWHLFLAQQGFLVLQVNVRSASGRGHVHASTCYRQLGVQELKDLEDAVDHACARYGGDPARVAIAGWSYGGFMAAYALTHSKKFAMGFAGAGVYDWRLYDTVYTERYMRTPADNQLGYDATSVIKAAADLHGHLVLVHGSMDDNVHLQNSMQLLWALQTAGKQNFEVMFYPRSRHGLARQVAQHHREFEWRRLQRLLDPAFKTQ